MVKRVKIPGRLESAETGNIVTGADAVMDDAKGKTQVVINSEVDAAIINLAQGKQDNLTFDSAPTEDSPNPVTSAGVYTADKVLSDAIEAILLLIPSAASALNKLVDMQTMNSSIATATASFKGTYNLVSDLHLGVDATHEQIGAALDALSLGADNNDYAFVQVPNSATAPTEISKTERYKFNGTNWLFEYDLNNSGFTQGQWNAINSGVTSLLVGKLSDLPTNTELTTLLAGKQDNLTFDNVPTAGSPNPVKSGGVYARNNEIVALINALDAAKQDVLTFDNAPVEGSPNPVKSGGVYTAISAVQAAIVALDAAKQDVLTFDSTPTLGSPNPVTSSGIKAELNRIDGDITTLNDLYEALTQGALVIIAPTDTWPVASPASKTIYRVVDRTNTPPQYYSDYMWNGTAMVLMAEYDNAIDPVPTAGSNNLVKSGGVFASKSIVTLSKILKSYVSSSLSNGQYGYNIDANMIVYKDTDGNNHTFDVRDGVLYMYNGYTFVKNGSALSLCTDGLVVGVEDINQVGQSTGLYYSPSQNQLVFVSETSELSTSPGQIRTNVKEGTLMSHNTELYMINQGFNTQINKIDKFRKYNVALVLGHFILTGNAGGTTDFSTVANNGWQSIKRRVYKGDVCIVTAAGGNTPRAITVTDTSGNIIFASKGYNDSILINQDGYVVVNNSAANAYSFIHYSMQEADTVSVKVILSAILLQAVSQVLNNNEYGYVTGSKLVVYKDSSGKIASMSPSAFGDVEFVHNDVTFLPDETNGLKIKTSEKPVPIVAYNAVTEDARDEVCFSPTVKQLVYVSDTTTSSPSAGMIRTTVEDGTLVSMSDLVLRINGQSVIPVDGYPPMVHFTIDDVLKDFDGEAEDLPFNGVTLFTEIYAKMDELVSLYPDFVEKVDIMTYLATEMAALGVYDYPSYAKGIASETTVQASDVYGNDFPSGHEDYSITYNQTPAYKTYMYIFKKNKFLWGNSQANTHKKVLLVAGTHGNEKASQINCYNFAKQLCENLASDRNYFALRNSCDFYIIPCLNGYSLYHSLRNNANGVNTNRNFDCEDGFVEKTEGIYNDYTGPFAFSEFETKIVKCITEKINPLICIDHHSYTKTSDPNVAKYQVFFGDIPNAFAGRVAYQVAVDFSWAMQKHFPDQFGDSGNILLNSGTNLDVHDVRASQETSSWWSRMMNIPWSITCEVSHDIMYDHGVPVSEPSTWTATDEIFQINEYYLRITLLRMLEEAFSKQYK